MLKIPARKGRGLHVPHGFRTPLRYLCQEIQNCFIPSHRPYSGGTNHSCQVHIGIIGSVWFLDENRVIHHGEQWGVVDAVSDPNRFDPLRVSAHALLAMVAAQEHGRGLSLIVFPHQMK